MTMERGHYLHSFHQAPPKMAVRNLLRLKFHKNKKKKEKENKIKFHKNKEEKDDSGKVPSIDFQKADQGQIPGD